MRRVRPSLTWPEPELSDGRVRLRPWEAGDLPALLEATVDPAIQRFRYSVPRTEAAAIAWLAGLEPDRWAGTRLELAVTADGPPPSAVALGSISLTDLEPPSAMLRYWLLPAGRGRGIGSAAVRLLSGWAIATLAVTRVTLLIEADNGPSRRLAERCGFVLAGRRLSQVPQRPDLLVYELMSTA